jgi:GMP synthase (glutamine-hydrolysing)
VRILAVVNQPDAGPGVFHEAITAAGAELEVWSPPDEAAPPRSVADYAGVIVLGGAIHADQDLAHPWLASERELLAGLLRERVPVLGVCLGAQLLAQAAGGKIRRARVPEIGWCEVTTTREAGRDALLGELTPALRALQWHSYEFLLPPGATALAHSDVCLQAFRAGDAAWGIQFHAEVTSDDLDAWLVDYRSDPDAVEIGLDPGAVREQTRREIGAWNELGRRLCHRFLDVARD